MFADLRAELDSLPEVSVVAIGGIPVTLQDGEYCIFGATVTVASVRDQLTMALGLGAVLTYRNPKNKNLLELGNLCLEKGHVWTGHVLLLTLAFDQCPIDVRNAYAFDRRFHMSWVEREVKNEACTFTATGSVREWMRVIGYASAPSFREIQRAWFAKVGAVLAPLFPKPGSGRL